MQKRAPNTQRSLLSLFRPRLLSHHNLSLSRSLARSQGQSVEVSYTDEGSQEPAAWWEAKILGKKGGYCKVHFLCGSFPDEAVDEDLIRPATTATAKPLYTKQTVQLPSESIHAFFLANEGKIVADVREKAQLLAVTVEKQRAQIKLIGSSKSISMGKMLIDLHMRHHGDMHRIQSEREVLATKIETRQKAKANGIRVEFPVVKELIGLVVGKQGKTIQDVKKATGVDVIEVEQAGPTVVIVGSTQEKVDAAREMLEFVIERVPVQPAQVGWLIGRGGKNFKELQEKTKVTRLNVDKNTSTVILVGTVTAVAAAQLYIDTHLEYLQEFDKEKGETEKLQQQLDAMSMGDGYGKGKGGGGRGKGEGGLGMGRGGGRGGGPGYTPSGPTPTPSEAASAGRGKGKGKGGSSTPRSEPIANGKSEPNGKAEANGTSPPAPAGRAPGGPKRTPRENGSGPKPQANGTATEPAKEAPPAKEKESPATNGKAPGGAKANGKPAAPKAPKPQANGEAKAANGDAAAVDVSDALPQRTGKGRGRGGSAPGGEGKAPGRGRGGGRGQAAAAKSDA